MGRTLTGLRPAPPHECGGRLALEAALQEGQPVAAHDPVDLRLVEVQSEPRRQLLQLRQVTDGGVLRVETAVEVGAERDVLRIARRTRVMDHVPDDVLERRAPRRAEMALVEADPYHSSPPRDLGD